MLKDYDMSILYHLGKANVVADALSRITMGSVSHIDEAKKYLVVDVHSSSRFDVRLKNSPNGYFMVHNNSETSLIVVLKSKQHLDKSLMEYKDRSSASLMRHCP